MAGRACSAGTRSGSSTTSSRHDCCSRARCDSAGWSGTAAFWRASTDSSTATPTSTCRKVTSRRRNTGISASDFAPGRFASSWGRGLREYDFLAGVGRHKTDWGAEIKESRRVLVATRTYKNLLFCRAPEWQERATATAKRVLPDRVLTMRQATAGSARSTGDHRPHRVSSSVEPRPAATSISVCRQPPSACASAISCRSRRRDGRPRISWTEAP